MSESKTYKELAIVVESNQDLRGSMKEALEKAGFKSVQVAGNIEEVWPILRQDVKPNWIVTSYIEQDDYNTAQLIGLLVQQSQLKDVMLSLMVTEAEFKYIPSAFEMAAISYHKKPVVVEQLSDELSSMADRLEKGEDPAVIAAENLRQFFTVTNEHKALAHLEEALFKTFPTDANAFANLAKAQFDAGYLQEARDTLIKAKHTLKEEHDVIQSVGSKLAEKGEEFSTVGAKLSEILNLKTVLIVDSDESQVSIVKNGLESLTVEDIEVKTSADEAATWLETNHAKVSMIIASWSMPGITGAGLVQRVQSVEGIGAIPIIVNTSGLVSQDHLLLKEIGVADSITRPVQEEELKAAVLKAANKEIVNNESTTIFRKFQNAIKNRRLKIAKQLYTKLCRLEGNSDKLLKICESEILYAEGDFKKASEVANACFKSHGEDVIVLNLLGKCYLKLGDHMSALKCLNRAHLLSPENISRICQMAETQSEIGKEQEAQSAINVAEKVDKDSPKVVQTKAAVAVNLGKPEEAKSILENSPVVRNMVAYMNNRAVSLVYKGLVNKSLELYKNAQQALPESNSKERAILEYNHALACIRLEKLGEAMSILNATQVVKTDQLYMKVESLKKRLKTAIDSGQTMKLNSADREKKSGREEGPPVALHCKPGDLRLHHIYFAEELADKQFMKAISSIPQLAEVSDDDAIKTAS